MRRIGLVLGLVVLGVGVFVLWRSAPNETQTGAFVEEPHVVLQPSRWTTAVSPRGSRTLRGKVLRVDGTPVARAAVTAVVAHGDDVLSDLPCQCDNHCGQKLLECGCAEASAQLVELVAQRTGETAPVARTTTDASGTFTLEGLDDLTVTLWADAPGLVGLDREVSAGTSEVTITVSAGRLVRGTVTHTDGGAAGGSIVTAIFAERSRFFDGVAAADGTFTLGPLPTGTASVVALADGLLPDHQTLRKDDAEEVHLELSVPRSISGQVIGAAGPVSAIDVRVEGMHRKRRVLTDATGHFTVDRLRWGQYEVTVDGAAGFVTRSVTVSKHTNLLGLVLELETGRPFSGTVLDPARNPIHEAEVSIDDRKDWRNTRTDEAGRFHFPIAREGSFTLFVRSPGWLSQRREVEAGSSIEVVLERSAVLSGRVETTAGLTIPKFEVEVISIDGGPALGDDNDASSVDGGFRFDLKEGPYRLRVISEKHATASQLVTAPASVVVRLSEGGTVTGHVLDVDGKPVEKAFIHCSPAGEAPWRVEGKRSSSAMDGSFTISGLAPGDWTITAMPRDNIGQWKSSSTFTARNGVSTEVTLRPKAGAAVAGVVLTAEGTPAPATQVSAWSAARDGGAEAGSYERTTTDEEGRFRFRLIPAGQATAIAGDNASIVPFTAPTSNLVIKLPATTTIVGRVVDDEAKPLSLFRVNQQQFDSADGRFSKGLRPGSVDVGIDSPGFAQRILKVEVSKGRATDLGDIQLSRGLKVRGRVVDEATGAPLAGALVDVALEKPVGGFILSEERGAVVTDNKGAFSIAVDPTSKWLCVSHEEFEPRSQPLTAGAQEVRLKRGGVLEVTVLDEKGGPIPDVMVMAERQGEAPHWGMPGLLENSKLRIVGLSAGTWTVGAMSEEGQLPHRALTVQVEAGVKQVVLRPPTDGVEVHIVGLDGVAGAALYPGRRALTELSDSQAGYLQAIAIVDGVAKHVLPGEFTLVVTRRQDARPEWGAQSVIVTKEGPNSFKLQVQWQDQPESFGGE